MPNALSHVLADDPTSPLSKFVMFKNRHTVLIRDLPGLDPSVSQATGSMISSNIGDLVTEQRAARLEAETLRRRKEDKG